MTTGSTGTKRRTLLQRGIALLAGGAALAGTSKWAGAASAPKTSARTLTLYARTRPTADHAHGESRLVASGDLLDRPDGEPIGTFSTNCFCLAAPFGAKASASNLEFHVLQLAEGTLFSMGAGTVSSEQRLAIVGGTGTFAGRSGSYAQRAVPAGIGDDVRELTITFAG